MKQLLRRIVSNWFFALILGSAIASGYWIHYCRQLYNELVIGEVAGRIIDDVNTLASIRKEEKTNTITSKENDLSDEIWALSQAFSPNELSDTNSVRALKLAARYRRRYPYASGDADKDQSVEKFLDNFNTK